MSDDYVHPESGRVYRKDDPAVRFAKLTNALYEQSKRFEEHFTPEIGRDYLDIHSHWYGDLERIAHSMKRTLAEIEITFADLNYDRDALSFGLAERDDEWERKYGAVDDH